MARDRRKRGVGIEREGLSFGPPPIFCEQCPDLAMAVVDDAALCVRCMMAALRGRSESWIAEHTQPLVIHHPN